MLLSLNFQKKWLLKFALNRSDELAIYDDDRLIDYLEMVREFMEGTVQDDFKMTWWFWQIPVYNA